MAVTAVISLDAAHRVLQPKVCDSRLGSGHFHAKEPSFRDKKTVDFIIFRNSPSFDIFEERSLWDLHRMGVLKLQKIQQLFSPVDYSKFNFKYQYPVLHGIGSWWQ